MNIDYAALGMRAVQEDKEAQGDLHLSVDDGEITLEQIGRAVVAKQPDHPAISEFDKDAIRQGGWEQDFANLPKIPGVVDAVGGVLDYVGGPVDLTQRAMEFVGTGDLQRGFVSGMTLGTSELAAQGIASVTRRLGAPAYQAPNSAMFSIGEFAGSMVPYMRGGRFIQESKWLQNYLTKFPRAKEYLEDALLGGTVEGIRGAIDPNRDVTSGVLGGLFGGPIGTGIGKGLKGTGEVAAGMVARPKEGPGSLTAKYPLIGPGAERLAKWVGLTKTAIDEEFVKVLDKYGYPHVPAVVRPLDTAVQYITKKVVRATSALPDLAKVNRMILTAIGRHQSNVVQMLRPKKPLKVGEEVITARSNTDTGNAIRLSYREQVDTVHNQADQLYNEANRILGKSDVDTKNLITRLKEMLDEAGYTPRSAADEPEVNKVQNIISTLERLSKDKPDAPVIFDATGNPILGQGAKEIEYKPAKFDWVHNKYKSLRNDFSGPSKPADLIVFNARDIIRKELSDAAAKHSDAAASLMQQANTKWAVYKKMRWPKPRSDENPMGKVMYESKGDDLVPKIFDNVTNIRQVREYLGQEAYELSRQRHLENILFKGKPKGLMPGKKPDPKLMEEGINIQSLNDEIERVGGIDGEIWNEMFKGEPEKLAALQELHRTVNRFAPVYRAYRGVAEEAGGGEQGAVTGQVNTLLGRESMAIQFGIMKKLGQSLTEPKGANIWLGRKWGSGPIDPDLIQAAATRQDALRAATTQVTARLTGEFFK